MTLIAALSLLAATATAGDVSTVYQGRVLDAVGTPVNGNETVTVRLYEQASGGSPLWSDDATVALEDGYFSVTLSGVGTGSTDLDAVIENAGFIGVQVGTGDELVPRRALGAVPRSATTHGVVSINAEAGCVQPGGLGWAPETSLMYVCDGAGWVVVRSGTLSIDNGRLFAPSGSGNVGVGTRDPQATLHVFAPDNAVSTVAATGTTQGSGVFYAGQSSTYGGGLAYNGDNAPEMVGGVDRITLFRRDNGTDTEVMSYPYNGNTVQFAGTIYARPSMYVRNVSITSSVRCAQCDSEDQLMSCMPHALDNCAGNPCDADVSIQMNNQRCCAGSNDATGWSLAATCMQTRP